MTVETLSNAQRARQSNYQFQKAAKKARGANVDQKTLEDAREWFRNEALNVKKVSPKKMIETAGAFENMNQLSAGSIGKMYMFYYDAKWKKELSYWDAFPLIFPIEFYKDSMLGINLHYLHPMERATLMDALYETINNTKMNKTTKLRISYQILKGATKFRYFKPCIHKYLFSYVKSQFQYVKPENWDYALMLPSERFQKKSKEFVWQDSMDKVS